MRFIVNDSEAVELLFFTGFHMWVELLERKKDGKMVFRVKDELPNVPEKLYKSIEAKLIDG